MRVGTDIEVMPAILLSDAASVHDKAEAIVRIHRETGSKNDPLMIGDVCIHPDSCGLEFTTPVVDNAKDLAGSIEHSFSLASNVLGMEFVYHPYMDMTGILGALYEIAPDVHHIVTSMGCSADYTLRNYMRDKRIVPAAVRASALMTLGGHLHIDLEDSPEEWVEDIAEALAPYHTSERDAGYGWYRHPLVYRPKPYGVEYRSLSNEWAEANAEDVFNTLKWSGL